MIGMRREGQRTHSEESLESVSEAESVFASRPMQVIVQHSLGAVMSVHCQRTGNTFNRCSAMARGVNEVRRLSVDQTVFG